MTIERCVGPGTSTWTSTRYSCTVNGVANWTLQWNTILKVVDTMEGPFNTPLEKCVAKWGADETVTLVINLIDGTGPITSWENLGPPDVTGTIISGALHLTVPPDRRCRIHVNGAKNKPLFVHSSILEPAIPVGSVSWADFQTANPGQAFIPDGYKLHFPAGDYTIPLNFVVGNNCTVHFARDAVVDGTFYMGLAPDSLFQGTGTWHNARVDPETVWALSEAGTSYDELCFYSLATQIGSTGYTTETKVKGLTMFSSAFHFFTGGFSTAEDCTFLAYARGGIGNGPAMRPAAFPGLQSVVRRCLIDAGDDAVFGTNSEGNAIIEDCTIGTNLNSTVHLGYWAFERFCTQTIRRNYLYHLALPDNNTEVGYPSIGDQTVFGSRCDAFESQALLGWGHSDVNISDCTVVGPLNARLLYLRNEKYPYATSLERDGAGNIGYWTITNLVCEQTPAQLSYVTGRDANNTPHDITIEGLEIGGVPVNVGNWSDFVIQNQYPYNIFIEGEEYMAITLDFSGLSYRIYTADGAATTYPIVIDYLEEAHLVVQVNGVTKTAGVHYNITSGSVVFTAGNLPAVGAQVKILRQTPLEYSARKVDFQSFGAITEDQMDLDQKQTWLLIQEAKETTDTGEIDPEAEYIFWDSAGEAWSGVREGNPQRITNVADPSSEQDVATKAYVDSISEWGSAGVPQSWEFTATGATNTFTLEGGESIDADYLVVSVAGAPKSPISDFSTIPDSASTKLVFAVTPTTGQKIVVQNFGKARFINTLVPGTNSVGTAALQDQSVTTAKLDDVSVTTAKLVDGSVTGAKLAAGSVNVAALGAGVVTAAKIADAFMEAPGGPEEPLFFTITPDSGAPAFRRISPLDLQNWIQELQNVPLSTFANPVSARNMGGQKITNLGAPTSSTDASTKAYVDAAVGSAVGNKVDLVFQNTLAANASVWTWFDDGTIAVPSAWTDATYLYYSFVISNLKRPSTNANNVTMEVRRAGSGTWQTLGSTAQFGDAGTLFDRPRIISGYLQPPRTPYDTPIGLESPGGFGANAYLANDGQIVGIRIQGSGATMLAGATVQIYGHKAL